MLAFLPNQLRSIFLCFAVVISSSGNTAATDGSLTQAEQLESISQSILTAPTERALIELRAKLNDGVEIATTEYWLKAIDILIDHRLAELQETRWRQDTVGNAIDTKRLAEFLDRFAAAYDVGDLPQFLTLFDNDAQSNNQSGLQKIGQSYAELFKKTKDRHMIIRDMSWKRYPDRAHGRGSFEVRLSKQGKPRSYTGKIVLSVSHNQEQLRISELYYSACELDTL